MAITARGAWECVSVIFREMGVDISEAETYRRGNRRLAGDVSATECAIPAHPADLRLQSPAISSIRQPDRCARGRAGRMFTLPRSQLGGIFVRKQISKGGGVYSRAATKPGPVGRRQSRLELPAQVTPTEVLKAILKAHGESDSGKAGSAPRSRPLVRKSSDWRTQQ